MMNQRRRRTWRTLTGLIAYVIPIVAAVVWYPRSVDQIGPMPLGFIIALVIAVAFVFVADRLDR